MLSCDTLIRNANVLDGSGAEAERADVAMGGDRIVSIGPGLEIEASAIIDGGRAVSRSRLYRRTHA